MTNDNAAIQSYLFAPVTQLVSIPWVLIANTELPVKSVADLIALAKKQPGKLSYASSGIGTPQHVLGEQFEKMAEIDMLHVPYKGIAQAIADALANEVQLTYGVMPAAYPHIQGGRLRALGVTGPKRAPLLPNVPSISEAVPGYEMLGWYSAVAPTGTPAAILNKISAEAVKAVKEPVFAEQLKSIGVEIVGGDRAALDAWRRGQAKKTESVAPIGANGYRRDRDDAQDDNYKA